jgi:hypothetical protein
VLHVINVWGAGEQLANDVAVDSSGNIYVAGSFNGDLDLGEGPLANSGGGNEMFVAKFCGGALEWVVRSERVGGTGSAIANGLAIVEGETTEVYVTGQTNRDLRLGAFNFEIASTEGDNAFILRIADGEVLDAVGLGIEAENGQDVAVTDDAVYITGNCEQTDDSANWGILVARTDRALNGPVAHCTYSSLVAEQSTLGQSIAVTADGDLVIGGSYRGTLDALNAPSESAVNGFVARLATNFSPAGATWRWFKVVGNDNTVDDDIRDVAALPDGDIVAAGRIAPGLAADCDVVNEGGLVVTLAPDGTCLQARVLPTAGVQVGGVAPGGSNALTIAGEFTGTLYQPPVSLADAKGVALFVMHVAADGAPRWGVTSDHSASAAASPLTRASRTAVHPSLIGVIGKTDSADVKVAGTRVGNGDGTDSFVIVLQP